MRDRLYFDTKVVSYFLWEYTKFQNALDLWYCAEDMGFFLEKENMLTISDLQRVLQLDKTDMRYIRFVRHIAYRVHIFTNNSDALSNWFVAERLLSNGEWTEALIGVALTYSRIRMGEIDIKDAIRTERIKKHFNY